MAVVDIADKKLFKQQCKHYSDFKSVKLKKKLSKPCCTNLSALLLKRLSNEITAGLKMPSEMN